MGGVITEDKESLIRTMVDEVGLLNAIKMMGDYYAIEPYLKEIDKVNYIKQRVSELCDMYGSTGVAISEFYESPIHFSDDENEMEQIEYLRINQVVIDVYDYNTGTHLSDYGIPYESLPGQIIDYLVEILINN
jgi:hypothetical protein